MEPVKFLDIALEFLAKQPVGEIDYRNAASRAYYCAFHSCKKLLEIHPPREPQRGAEHQKIIEELRNHQDRRFKKLGNMLADSRDQRVRADYGLHETFSVHDAKTVVKFTQKLLQEIQQIQSNN